jgi:hypothetical protein
VWTDTTVSGPVKGPELSRDPHASTTSVPGLAATNLYQMSLLPALDPHDADPSLLAQLRLPTTVAPPTIAAAPAQVSLAGGNEVVKVTASRNVPSPNRKADVPFHKVVRAGKMMH